MLFYDNSEIVTMIEIHVLEGALNDRLLTNLT